MAEVRVREAQKADAEFIVQTQLDMALETESRALDAERVNKGVNSVFEGQGRGFYLVAEIEGRAVGCLLVTFEWSDWRNGMFYWIQSAFVLPTHRRHGVFTAMYRYVETLGQQQGCGVRLYVDANNTAGQRTYERLGMTRTSYVVYEKDFVYETHQ